MEPQNFILRLTKLEGEGDSHQSSQGHDDDTSSRFNIRGITSTEGDGRNGDGRNGESGHSHSGDSNGRNGDGINIIEVRGTVVGESVESVKRINTDVASESITVANASAGRSGGTGRSARLGRDAGRSGSGGNGTVHGEEGHLHIDVSLHKGNDLNGTDAAEVTTRAELREQENGINSGTSNESEVEHASSVSGTRVDDEVDTGGKIGGDAHTERVTTVVTEVDSTETAGVEVDTTIGTIVLDGGLTTGTSRGSTLEETVGHTR